MSPPSEDHTSSRDVQPISSGGTSPLWLLVGASALFFAFAAALLASG